MITDRVIKEIYKKFGKSSVQPKDVRLTHYIDMLAPTHHMRISGDMVIFEDQEESNPFRKFLLRSLNGIIEFDRQVAFVFRTHIMFLGKDSDDMRIHFKPIEEKHNIFRRLLAKDKEM